MPWFAYALTSAIAAALTAILAKTGVEGVPSTLATAVRTIVVVVFSWAMVRALQLAPASYVAPIDKLSLPLTMLLAAVWLREPVSWQAGVGVALMVAGALLTRA